MRDSWDRSSSNKTFLEKIKRSWKNWKNARRIAAEEKAALRELSERGRGRSESSRSSGSTSYSSVSSEVQEKSVSADRNQSVQENIRESSKPKTLLERWNRYREIRKQVLSEQRGNEANYGGNKQADAWKGRSSSSFGVGSTEQSASEVKRFNPWNIKYLSRKLGQGLLKFRIPQWLAAVAPVVIITALEIQPAVNESEDHAARTVQRLKAEWPGVIESKSWDESQIIGQRIMNSGLAEMNDYFRYYETLVGMKRPDLAIKFLASKEMNQKEEELSTYKFRFGEKVLELPNLAREDYANAFARIRDSLVGPLTKEDALKARQLLANAAYVQGNLEAAIKIIEPIQTENVFLGTDALWIRWNIEKNPETPYYRNSAEKLLKQVETLETEKKKSDVLDSMIFTKSKLLVMAGREKEAREALAKTTGLDDNKKKFWNLEINKIVLDTEIRRKEPRNAEIWRQLEGLLREEPENPNWNVLAIQMWANSKTTEKDAWYEWVQGKLDSGKVSDDFLKKAAIESHMNSRWKEARQVYKMIIARDPKDLASLNNLAGINYKFPPYDFKDALMQIDQALALSPGNLGIMETKAQILARMGRLDESREILEQCLPQYPDEWNIHNTLAQIYEIQGDKNRSEIHRERLKTIKKPSNAPLMDQIVTR